MGLGGTEVETGRPTVFTREIAAIICQEISGGMPRKYAAARAGIAVRTFENWMERGKGGEEPFCAFAREVDDALAAHVKTRLEAMRVPVAKGGDWKREAWLLERLHPKEFGQLTKTQISGPNGGPVQTQASVVIVPGTLPDAATWAQKVASERSANDT